ncbi:hypothetical protein OJ996_24035 [Luteolibacter sp. GHJ8]|uniref:DUF4402 domain-containing protein n=1 Tax=Luteolibacter rhizosphaerae TaxID=2989719 RepID=A0ABT3GA01_9BACT|nr:hypothetical protein [Luteolibacter rhizosphaerae]MCW1916678.1 hypothetical protein [Luteolibacter rhizosphaerae]
MNTPLLKCGGRLLASVLISLLAIGSSPAADEVPTGTLSVDSNLLRTGSKSQLAWNITYPAPITSVIDIVPPNVIKPKKDLKMKVRVLGASFQESILSFLPVEVMMSKNGGSWSRVFYGLQSSVLPNLVLKTENVKKGDSINLGGRGYRDGWLPLYNTASTTNNLVMLKNGDRVPTTVPALNGSSIESFLKPYMDTATKKVKIGDRDLILLMELGQTDTRNSGFDLQDLVVLVTFE